MIDSVKLRTKAELMQSGMQLFATKMDYRKKTVFITVNTSEYSGELNFENGLYKLNTAAPGLNLNIAGTRLEQITGRLETAVISADVALDQALVDSYAIITYNQEPIFRFKSQNASTLTAQLSNIGIDAIYKQSGGEGHLTAHITHLPQYVLALNTQVGQYVSITVTESGHTLFITSIENQGSEILGKISFQNAIDFDVAFDTSDNRTRYTLTAVNAYKSTGEFTPRKLIKLTLSGPSFDVICNEKQCNAEAVELNFKALIQFNKGLHVYFGGADASKTLLELTLTKASAKLDVKVYDIVEIHAVVKGGEAKLIARVTETEILFKSVIGRDAQLKINGPTVELEAVAKPNFANMTVSRPGPGSITFDNDAVTVVALDRKYVLESVAGQIEITSQLA